jgi:colanic acid/amylovoran biosynthesis glycosyltransferase
MASHPNNSHAGLTPISSFGGKPRTVLSYCATFLKPEMMHVYRQVVGVGSFRNVVVTRRLENAARFPYGQVIQLEKSPWRLLHRVWYRLRRSRVPVSKHEAKQLSRIIRRENAALVHIYFGTEAARLLSWMPRAGVPIVVSFHGADVSDSISDGELQAVCLHASLLLHRSDSLREALLARGAPQEKLRANPTGVPVPGETTKIQIADGKPLRLLQACRFIEKKGIDVTLESAKILVDLGFDVRLTLAGDGPRRVELESAASRLGISSRVRWTGFLNSEQLAGEYRQHDVFLHPSRETGSGDREGIPNSLLEAMAHGCVVLGTRHSGIPEAVEDGVNGLLVDRADALLVADAVSKIASDPARAKSLGAAARQTILERFSTQACIRQLETSYAEVASHV